MHIRKTLSEMAQMLAKQSGRNISISQTAPGCIRLDYLIAIHLTLSGHTADSLVFRYRLGTAARLLAKGADSLFALRTRKLSADTARQEIRLHLNAFSEFRPLLATRQISSAVIENDALVVGLEEKQAV